MHKDLIDRSEGFFVQTPHKLILGIQNGNALLVYMILKTYSNNGSMVFPSRETIANHMGARSTRTVDAALKKLSDLGLVAMFPRWRNDEGKTSRKPDEVYKFQTSNGYILYDKIRRIKPDGWADPGSNILLPPLAEYCEGGVQDSAHEQEPVEQEPVEQYTPIVPKGIETDAFFDEWYEHYPKKAGRGQAVKAFKTAIKKTDLETMIAATLVYAKSVEGKEKRFIKNPSTWLNGECWLDDVDVPDSFDDVGGDDELRL